MLSGDKVYISCMATNISDDEYWEGFREIWSASSDAINWDTHINLLQLYHSRFSSALLCCDSGGTVSDVWFVDKVMAGKLTEKDGMIYQQIARIDMVEPPTFSMSSNLTYISGTEYAFGFDADGNLADKEKTGYFRIWDCMQYGGC